MLSKTTEYAIRALVYIQLQNWEKKRPGIIEVAREIEAPEAFCAKVLQTLTRHKLLMSMKGRGGGFFFDPKAPDLSLHKVIVVMEGDHVFTGCGFGLKNCDEKNPCPLHDQYIKVRQVFYEIATKETIQSLSLKITDGNAVLNSIQSKYGSKSGKPTNP
jgi:Rrf2 family protein